MAKIFYQSDCNLGVLKGKTVAVIGYGSQGHAHALNLHESGVDVVVGLYIGSKSWSKAEEAGLKVMTAADATKAADVIMMLINDERQADLYRTISLPTFHPARLWHLHTASTSISGRLSRRPMLTYL